MKMPTALKLTQVLALVAAFSACGKSSRSDDEDDAGSDSVVDDAQLNQEAANASLTDAVEAMSDSNEAGASASSLALATAEVTRTDNSTFTKSCAADGDNAVVTIDADIDVKRSLVTRRAERSWVLTGSEDITRTWSKEVADAAVAVGCSGKHAAITWSADPTGVSVDIDFKRTRVVNVDVTNKISGETFSRDKSFSAEGSRQTSWLSQTTDSAAATITRIKEISSNVDRVHNVQNSDGADRELIVNVKTAEDAPLSIEVVRGSADLELQSKTIQSGQLIETREGKGKIETVFADLKTEFSDTGCTLVSGSATFKFYNEGESEAAKTYKLEAAAGVYTYTNVDTGVAVDDYEFEGCDIRAFAE